MARFQNIQELQEWIKNNLHLGLFRGKSIIDSSIIEVRGAKIPKSLYDRTLLIAASMGFSKSETGKAALVLLINHRYKPEITEIIQTIGNIDHIEGRKPEFRYYVSKELYNNLGDLPKLLGKPLMTAIALTYWCDTHQEYYQEWIELKMKITGLTQEEIEQLIFDYWLMQSSKKRLEMSIKKGSLILDEKLS